MICNNEILGFLFSIAGEGRLGTDEAEFINIFGHESFDQLALVFEKYKEYQGRTIEQALDAELPGELLQEITLGIGWQLL